MFWGNKDMATVWNHSSDAAAATSAKQQKQDESKENKNNNCGGSSIDILAAVAAQQLHQHRHPPKQMSSPFGGPFYAKKPSVENRHDSSKNTGSYNTNDQYSNSNSNVIICGQDSPNQQRPTLQELEEVASGRAEKSLKTWYQRLHELEQYKQAHGHCNVPQTYPANQKLANWVNKQRMEKNRFDDNKSGKDGMRKTVTSMTERRIALLEDIGFVWSKRKGEVSWEASYEKLKAFHAHNGHCKIPTKNGALGRWVSSQRANYKAKTITSERIARLEKLGFMWLLKETTVAAI